MKRIVVVIAGALLLAGAYVAPAAALPDPCALLTKAEVSQILGKKVVHTAHREDGANQAARCTYSTKFFQTPTFKRSHASFELKVDTQATSAAEDDLAQLRNRSNDPGDTSVKRVEGIGDEAYFHFFDLIVVSGDNVIVVGVGNFDTSKKPHPDVEQMARKAAALALPRLQKAPSL